MKTIFSRYYLSLLIIIAIAFLSCDNKKQTKIENTFSLEGTWEMEKEYFGQVIAGEGNGNTITFTSCKQEWCKGNVISGHDSSIFALFDWHIDDNHSVLNLRVDSLSPNKNWDGRYKVEALTEHKLVIKKQMVLSPGTQPLEYSAVYKR